MPGSSGSMRSVMLQYAPLPKQIWPSLFRPFVASRRKYLQALLPAPVLYQVGKRLSTHRARLPGPPPDIKFRRNRSIHQVVLNQQWIFRVRLYARGRRGFLRAQPVIQEHRPRRHTRQIILNVQSLFRQRLVHRLRLAPPIVPAARIAQRRRSRPQILPPQWVRRWKRFPPRTAGKPPPPPLPSVPITTLGGPTHAVWPYYDSDKLREYDNELVALVGALWDEV